MTAVWSTHLPDSEKIVLLALADCANDEGQCWPSMATLAAKCSKSDRTVQAAIKALEKGGHLTRIEIPGKGCRYGVHPTPEDTSPPKPLRPAESAPPKRTTLTPEAASDKPSRTSNPQKASPSSVKREPAKAIGTYHRLPNDWTPSRPLPASIQAKVSVWPPGKVDDELAAMHRWAANADNVKGKGRKLDWDTAFANWLSRADDNWRPRNAPHQQLGRQDHGLRGPRPDPSLDLLRAARIAEEAADSAGSDWPGDSGTWLAVSTVGAG